VAMARISNDQKMSGIDEYTSTEDIFAYTHNEK